MITQNNIYSLSFGAYYDTENLVRCVANKGKRISERLNFVIDINRLKKKEAVELLKNKALIEQYNEIAKAKICRECPGFDRYIKKAENTPEDNFPQLIDEIVKYFGEEIEINQKGGRSYFA